MEKAGNVLGRVLKNHDIARVSALGRLESSWPSLVGASVAAHTLPVDLRNRVLFLSVDSPVWMQQLSFLKSELIEKLKGHGVDDIIFRHGRVRPYQSRPTDMHEKGFTKKDLSGRDLEYIRECANSVVDPGLKKAVSDLLSNALTRDRGKDSG